MSYDSAAEKAGEVGRDLADKAAGHLIQTIAGFPHSTPEQRAGIARVVSFKLDEYADAEEGGG